MGVSNGVEAIFHVLYLLAAANIRREAMYHALGNTILDANEYSIYKLNQQQIKQVPAIDLEGLQ